ncbi:putative membrane protein [Rhizobium sp. BK650]|uniref:alpha/beta hydrolase n=1 Tax=Rhizobium sp. BK650 TaxID=2586990 RepID=UPI0016188EB8|nr:alpha/beta-hydrolase family protein [Rhizobium sp. BK650]MBB3660562.1 putative membrane protein [Rhizobium sp. BK650]
MRKIDQPKRWNLSEFWTHSSCGLFLGTLFFVASLTPTLIPRTFLTQGVLSGICFAAGYGIGVLCRTLWRYMELPEPRASFQHKLGLAVAVLCALVAATVLWRTAEWQNSIRKFMELEPVASAEPLQVSTVAAATFLSVVALAQLFRFVFGFISRTLRRFFPRRVSQVIGFAAAVVLFWAVANGLLVRYVFHMLDASFEEYDAFIEPERLQPTEPFKTGSKASFLKWNELGRAGREFVGSGPSGSDISVITGRSAREPIRVYVGLRAAETTEQRAKLALEELKRAHGFDRSILVVITPTGTGWIDPAAIDSVEYLHDGDVASVALQYSYLSSPLSLIIEPEYGANAARALFVQIYNYWTTLPREHRPKLYVHGLSLGSLNSEKSVELLEMLGDPINGALWSGPPFENKLWRSVTENRVADSPAWLPQYRDGSFVRFMNQEGSKLPPDAPWGIMRIVYLQYASDPVTFFDFRDFYRMPDWMVGARGPDVSPELRWYPVVSMLQLAVDMAMATTTPIGYGHVYAPEHYVDAWIAVSDVQGWSAGQIAQVKRHLAQKIAADVAEAGEETPGANRGG